MEQDQLPSRWVGEVREHKAGKRLVPLLEPTESYAITVPPGHGLPPDGTIVVAAPIGDGAADIVHVLAAGGTVRSDIYRLAARFGLDPLYPDEVHREVELLQAAPGIDNSDLVDLEGLPFVTIDNDDSRDLDQALFIRREEDGTSVFYALADASFYVRPGSALFAEALKRGASFYFPGMAMPMLPRALSEDLISLNPEVARRSLICEMRLDIEGRCRRTSLFRARIRSRKKLSYGAVQRFWDDEFGSPARVEEWRESLELLREVGLLRIREARRRHVVDHNRVELTIRPANGSGWKVEARDRLMVERCNEQISLLCNVEGAKILAESRGLDHVQPIFRVHPEPTPEAVGQFEELVAALVELHDLDPERWGWRPGEQSLDEYLGALPRRAWPAIAEAVERQAILMNRRSLFGDRPGAHHGIGAPVYARFSSPMREIVGIFTHKEALESMAEAGASEGENEDARLRQEVIDAGNRSKWLQRTLEKEVLHLVLDDLFAEDLEREFEDRPRRRGVVLGMKAHLCYVRLEEPPVEVKIHFKDLEQPTGSGWKADRFMVRARPTAGGSGGDLRVGGTVSLKVVGHDRKRRRWLLAPVSD